MINVLLYSTTELARGACAAGCFVLGCRLCHGFCRGRVTPCQHACAAGMPSSVTAADEQHAVLRCALVWAVLAGPKAADRQRRQRSWAVSAEA